MLGFIGILLVAGGLYRIVAKDRLWGFMDWLNRSRGVASDRTEEWDMAQSIGGVIAIIVGVVLLIMFFNGFDV
jgi:hypothetical protein